MPLGKIAQTAIKIIKKNPEYFEALVEYEKIGRLPKLNYKKRVNFTIDTALFKEFREYCQKTGIKMSTEIERLLRKELGN